MYWAIKVAVAAVQKELPSIKKIMYSDAAVISLGGKRTVGVKFDTDRLRNAFKLVKDDRGIRGILTVLFYRFDYYERLGFEFDADWRRKIGQMTEDLFQILERSEKAKAANKRGKLEWSKLFWGDDYHSWPLFKDRLHPYLKDKGFHGDLVEISAREKPKKRTEDASE